tara:strand:- start:266 stop:433 length:168 start_codon:yes stop_codon:yes gene_type:complete
MSQDEIETIIVDLKKIVIETEAIAKEANENLEKSQLVLSMMEYKLSCDFGGGLLQ